MEPPPLNPDEVRAKTIRLIPTTVRDRQGWASDIYVTFSAQQIYPSDGNLYAVLVVTKQEPTYQVDPPVANLGRIATREVECRAGKLCVPALLVSLALNIKSSGGRTYGQRLTAACTEKGLSKTLDDSIAIVPMGGRLFGGSNPVHAGGSMQVSITFAKQHADDYPYSLDDNIRCEVFSRHDGMHFSIAHLLSYPADYLAPLYRSADFDAGWYVGRSAAFQDVVSRVSGIPLALDDGLTRHDTHTPGSTELAARSLSRCLNTSDATIHQALEQGDSPEFVDNVLYREVFALVESATDRTLSHAVLPGIALESPKIIHKLTTAWLAKRVDERYQRCMVRARKH